MAGSFRRRRTPSGDEPLLFGWCMGPDGAAFQHVPWNPEGTGPVEPLDAAGKRIPGFCPGFFVSSTDTKNYKAGTTVYCQCPCHGPDQPEAWPGYAVGREEAEDRAMPDEEELELEEEVDDDLLDPAPDVVDDSDDESPDDEEEVVSEPEPEATWTMVPAGEMTEVSPPPLLPGAAGEINAADEVETKRIKYPSGEVARVEVPGTGRGGKPVTNVNWVAYDKAGARLGREWSLTAAKKLLP